MDESNAMLIDRKEEKMKIWERKQKDKGYLTWQEYLEAIKEDELRKPIERDILSRDLSGEEQSHE